MAVAVAVADVVIVVMVTVLVVAAETCVPAGTRSSGFFRFGQGINNDSGNSKHRYAGNYRHFAMLFACSPASLADEAQRGRGFEFTCKHNSCSCSCAPQSDKAWSNIATVAHQPNKPSTQGLHRKLCKPLPYL